jgi:hypothetical protein
MNDESAMLLEIERELRETEAEEGMATLANLPDALPTTNKPLVEAEDHTDVPAVDVDIDIVYTPVTDVDVDVVDVVQVISVNIPHVDSD